MIWIKEQYVNWKRDVVEVESDATLFLKMDSNVVSILKNTYSFGLL